MRQQYVRDERLRLNALPRSLIERRGTSVPAPAVGRRENTTLASCLRGIVWAVDSLLRRAKGIFEFSTSDLCLLRIAFARANKRMHLADEVLIERGGRVADLHLWNEHLPPIPEAGLTVAWVGRIRRQMLQSLMELAAYAETSPGMANVIALRARVAFASRGHQQKVARIAGRFGFEHIESGRSWVIASRVHDLVEDFWLLGLVWAFNPRSLRRRTLVREHSELWISKAALIEKFGGDAMNECRSTARRPVNSFAH
jgi:YkoP domain